MSSSMRSIAKRKAKGDMIKFVLESIVIAMVIAITTSFASCTLFGGEQKHNVGIRTEQTKTGDDENQIGGNNNIVVNPGNENGNSGENNQNGNNNENNNENGGENNNNGGENSGEHGGDQEDPNNNIGENGENQGENNGENSGENGNSGENQGENGNSGENQGENQGENNGENGENSGNENSEDPNQEDPNQGDPNPDDPEVNPQSLDFSGLEAKLEEVITSQSKYNKVNEIISYSINEGKFYVIIDYEAKHGSRIGLYNMETLEDLASQDSIERFILEVNASKMTGITFGKATSDITVDDQTYSKDGIEGDNPFARQCGVENAWMTYVSDIGKPVLNPNSSTNYFSGYQVLVVFLQEGEIFIRNQPINVECEKGYSEQEILEASFSGEKYVGGELQLSEFINLGKSLINSQIAEASD